MIKPKSFLLILAIIFCMYQSCENRAGTEIPDPGIWVRKGFKLSIAVNTIKNPRFLKFSPDGVLFVALPGSGEIKSCFDKDGDGTYEVVKTFVKGHQTVHGMVWHDGWLWFTVSGAVFKARDKDGDGVADEEVTVIPDGQLPKGGGHWYRSILITGNRLYTSIGCSGNINDDSKTDRLKIWSYDLNGGDKKLFCSGLRNTEKLLVRPGSDEIWGFDHGSDNFGQYLEDKDAGSRQPITDLNPPGEFNHYVQDGFYGHPFIVGNRVPRYEYMNRPDIVELAAKTIPPAWCTGAHWAPCGWTFCASDKFPTDMKGDAFVAFHGSWNRTDKAGYCVDRVLFDDGKPYGELTYVKFLTDDGKVLGRPVDVVNAPDGSLLFSDDLGNKIYRLTYAGS